MKNRMRVVIFITGFSLIVISVALGLVPSHLRSAVSPSQHQMSDLHDPHIVIREKERSLELFDGGRLVKKYQTALGFTPTGDKEVEGDGRTPEGEFYVF